MTCADFAKLVRISVKSLQHQLRRRPDEYPRPVRLPNGHRRFRVSQVREWLRSLPERQHRSVLAGVDRSAELQALGGRQTAEKVATEN